ncbi:MAG: cytidylate kinase-like family protein [Lachnospiraceae bacterium]|nr:cytidylate kinase-like family protein [Lachnospiraceae bacterium]
MRHKIICIDRACGSGGKEIGHRVADKLGIGFHDSNLLEMAKEHGGITSDSLDNSDEKATNPFYYKLIYEGNENAPQERPATEMLFHLQSAVIQQLAKEEDCVIVGRCADFVLKDEDVDVISVFITSPVAHRIEREMEVDDMSYAQAKKFVRKMDFRRRNYYNYFAKGDWGKKNTYDMVLNSDKLGIDGTVNVLCALYEQIMGK